MPFQFNFSSQQQQPNKEPSQQREWRQVAEQQLPLPENITIIGERAIQLDSSNAIYKRHLSDIKLHVASIASNCASSLTENSDLIQGVYEGGLKTWECSIDLVHFLGSCKSNEIKGKSVFEIGCGTSLPGIFCLLSGAASVCFQDYNPDVIQTVTIPNILLNVLNQTQPLVIDHTSTTEVDTNTSQLPSNVSFYSGDWHLLKSLITQRFDVILTCETIYSQESHMDLHELILSTLAPSGVAYVAAKNTYFGCTGSMPSFLALVKAQGKLESQVVWECTDNVKREIIKLQWI